MSHPIIIEGDERVPVGADALVLRVAPGSVADPANLAASTSPRLPARIPCTLASALAGAGLLDLSHPPALESDDVWFTCALPRVEGRGRRFLVMEGLATLADVFVNGRHVLASDDAFHRHAIDVSDHLCGDDQLAIRFASLDAHLARKRSRPRWKTRLVAHQNLRFVRTPLIGRTTGFCPAVPAVGPYRPIHLERRTISVAECSCRTRCVDEGGRVDLELVLAVHDENPILAATLEVEGAAPATLVVEPRDSMTTVRGAVELEHIERWWPHTHGSSSLHSVRVVLRRQRDERILDLGKVGFRTVDSEDPSGFGLRINGVPVFARGAVWTTEDVLTQSASPEKLREALLRVRDSGMNLIRIGGTMGYETDAFHALADELGILVWQDLAFANMDYPSEDEAFLANVQREIRELLGRIGTRPSTVVICGNSEVEQQAAMLGLPRELWRSPLFETIARDLTAELAPGVPYVPSSPSGGTMPFHVDDGIGHYYGVGAYLRPLSDARTSGVRFASECLAFANVPCQATIDAFLRELEAAVHHPRWKERVPRDRGASWDFEDVRDHYLEQLFRVDARKLRYDDVERYLMLSRIVPGEVIARVFAEWRRAGSSCRGGIVFFLQDFWPGAGFGLVDSFGRAKAALRIAARSLAPLALLLVDEGVNGLYVHVANDGPADLSLTLRARLFRDGEFLGDSGERAVFVKARSVERFHVDAIFERFVDTTYAYRFGPPSHDLVFVEALTETGGVVARAHHLPLGLDRAVESDLGMEARFEDEGRTLRVRSRRTALFLAIDVEGARPEEDFFHLAPHEERTIALGPLPGRRALRGCVHPSNQRHPTRITS